jgi:hypothetical protein
MTSQTNGLDTKSNMAVSRWQNVPILAKTPSKQQPIAIELPN